MMDDDKVGQPIWPAQWQQEETKQISLVDLAEEHGLTEEGMNEALDILIENGFIIPTIVPLCFACGEQMSSGFRDPENLPEEFLCFHCGQHQDLEDADLRERFLIVKMPDDEDDEADEADD